MRITLTPWQAHVDGWKDCTRCGLHRTRSSVVLARGSVPCDVVFVGEAPGRSEDALGKPFIGPAGAMLDGIVAEAFVGTALRVAFTNLVACIPIDPDDVDAPGGVGEPPDDAIAACAPRLVEFVRLARPRLIVRVGRHAQHWLSSGHRGAVKLGWDGPFVDLLHPAAILRMPHAQQDHQRRRAVVVLRSAVEKLG